MPGRIRQEDIEAVRERVDLAKVVGGYLTLKKAGPDSLVGIFTERDVLTRVVGHTLDPRRTPLGAVMTRDPEALSPRDRVAYALNRMSVAGYRTIPLIDADKRPIGVATVTDFIRWLVDLFPEAVLNIRPGDEIKRPHEVDAG